MVLEYILVALESLEISCDRIRNIIASFLECISCWQGADAQTRQAEIHIKRENYNWKQIYGHIAKTRYSRRKFALLVSRTRKSLKIGLIDSLARLRIQNMETNIILVDGIEYNVICCKVSEEQVSYYNPVHWFIAQLLSSASIANGDRQFALGSTGAEFKSLGLEIMEYPLQTVVILAQIKAGMWIRNGESVSEQCKYYQSMLRDVHDNDIFIIQLVAAFSAPDHFLVSLTNRFEISSWLGIEVSESTTSTELPESKMLKLVEELLFLLSVVISERHRIVGVTWEIEMEREILHHLAASPHGMTLEEIYEKCCPRLTKTKPTYVTLF